MVDLSRYRGKRVFITGHTGFKGAWLCRVLQNAGATVTGYALEPPTEPSLFTIAGIGNGMESVIGDIRNYQNLKCFFEKARPEYVLHLAAQPIVRASYAEPRCTYETNVMGTVNLLECVRQSDTVRSFLNVTTDKVYENKEWIWGYRENEPLDGYDPYSNSKSCSELVTHCYKKSFFGDTYVALSTARAGNVIGGGDFAADRIIPDCVRAALAQKDILIRNPHSTRPYQHVLDPIFAYLMIAAGQYDDFTLSDSYNVGPDDADCVTTGDLVTLFTEQWGGGLQWMSTHSSGPHEATFLKLDCSKLKSVFGWKPRWDLKKAVEKTVEWTKCWQSGSDVRACMDAQIAEFIGGCTQKSYHTTASTHERLIEG
ncbi:MAG: CDP-glucose 4,6-dehydratase [Lawsonibacter sp.]|nr:CDP-glucose 4,6-dehydratase [Lawsonibacter sp.]